jgi:hypothetical protein
MCSGGSHPGSTLTPRRPRLVFGPDRLGLCCARVLLRRPQPPSSLASGVERDIVDCADLRQPARTSGLAAPCATSSLLHRPLFPAGEQRRRASLGRCSVYNAGKNKNKSVCGVTQKSSGTHLIGALRRVQGADACNITRISVSHQSPMSRCVMSNKNWFPFLWYQKRTQICFCTKLQIFSTIVLKS